MRPVGGYRGGYCERDMPSLTAHLRPGKERKRHKSYKDQRVQVVDVEE